MKSFELSTDCWSEIQSRLRAPLQEVQKRRRGFPDVEKKLQAAMGQLRNGPGLKLFDIRNTRKVSAYSPIPQAETLVFSKRHPGESSEAGYRAIVRRVESEHSQMQLSCDLLRQMHRHMNEANDPKAGQWKKSNNFFAIYNAEGEWTSSRLTLAAGLVPEHMEGLHERLASRWRPEAFDLLLTIAAYWLDLLCIHPFWDGNGRVARLAVLLLLYKAGYSFGKYVSLEDAVSRRRMAYTEALRVSMDGWEAACHDPYRWCRFVVDLVCDSHVELSRRADALSDLVKHIERSVKGINGMPRVFRTDELRSRLQNVPEDIMISVLNRMKDSGRVIACVRGDHVEWRRLDVVSD